MRYADKIFYASIAGFVAGVFVRAFVDVGIGFELFLVLLAVVFFLYARYVGTECLKPVNIRRRLPHTLFAVFLFTAALGMVRYDFADRVGPQTALDASLGQFTTIEGVVRDEPDERESVTRLIVDTSSTKVLVTTNTEPVYAYGDRLSIRGRVERPKNFTDETTLREVDYRSYLAKDGIYYEMFKPNIVVLARGKGNWVVGKLLAFKQAFIRNIDALIPEPHAALLGGLVVGAKHSLGKKLLDDFRTVGVIHIVVLSGYNITIIACFIEWLCSRLRKSLRLGIAAGAMILFALMVGASATVVRATLMALFVVLARGTGRVYAVTRALLVAGVVMLVHNPKILVFDTSFQLSFLATVGLIYLSPLIAPRVWWVTEKYHLREVVVATVATQLFVLPFILYKTGLFSVVALPVNILILAAIPATMLFGFLAGMAGFVAMTLALPFAWAAYALLAYELAVVEWFARLPFAAIALASFPLWLAVLWYVGYGVVMWQVRSRGSVQSSPS